jgi:predicted nucleic acid-binding protein
LTTGRRRILLDSGPLYALTDTRDQRHQDAQRELAILLRERFQPLVTAPTLFETQRLVLHRAGIQHAQRWLTEVRSGVDILLPEPDNYSQAIELAMRYSDQDLSLFDTLLYVISEQLRVPIWTYDHHFDILRANRWQP